MSPELLFQYCFLGTLGVGAAMLILLVILGAMGIFKD